jgi:hypothetical protein
MAKYNHGRQIKPRYVTKPLFAFTLNKHALIRKITGKLAGELEVCYRAAQFSRAEATHESNKAENKYDARGQSKQAAELEAAIAEFEKLGTRNFADGDAIGIGALVDLEHGGESSFYFLGPRAGGTEVLHDKKEILVVTPKSPLGEQLMGKKKATSCMSTSAEQNRWPRF